ncbi:MAG: type III-A CRISPR-associated RAMP protein Csm3 [Candidatus Cloacimonetes bacterium]|nr:type III-A CRISPR-associated RAMP protein Csm3 [Candidatus Cloacimonadota bacterium]
MLKTTIISGYIVLKSGLHIGGNKDTMQIGGIDSPVIKNPLTKLPYIPGSSLKGKIRFLLEHYLDLVTDGNIPMEKDGNILRTAVIFGHLKHDTYQSKPTRVIFSDSNVAGIIGENGNIDTEALQNPDLELSEAKTEVSINRLSGTQGGGLRIMERVPAGVVFDLNITLKTYDESADAGDLDIILKGLKLLANDALGGSGSRGSGKIEFRDLKVNDKDISLDSIEL